MIYGNNLTENLASDNKGLSVVAQVMLGITIVIAYVGSIFILIDGIFEALWFNIFAGIALIVFISIVNYKLIKRLKK